MVGLPPPRRSSRHSRLHERGDDAPSDYYGARGEQRKACHAILVAAEVTPHSELVQPPCDHPLTPLGEVLAQQHMVPRRSRGPKAEAIIGVAPRVAEGCVLGAAHGRTKRGLVRGSRIGISGERVSQYETFSPVERHAAYLGGWKSVVKIRRPALGAPSPSCSSEILSRMLRRSGAYAACRAIRASCSASSPGRGRARA